MPLQPLALFPSAGESRAFFALCKADALVILTKTLKLVLRFQVSTIDFR